MLPLHLQPESHIPLYVQLRDQLRALVHTGELRFGDRIPASRELACQLGVHRTTVANAYAELESEGLIQGHVGRGTFICELRGLPNRRTKPAGVARVPSGAVGGHFRRQDPVGILDRLTALDLVDILHAIDDRAPDCVLAV